MIPVIMSKEQYSMNSLLYQYIYYYNVVQTYMYKSKYLYISISVSLYVEVSLLFNCTQTQLHNMGSYIPCP